MARPSPIPAITGRSEILRKSRLTLELAPLDPESDPGLRALPVDLSFAFLFRHLFPRSASSAWVSQGHSLSSTANALPRRSSLFLDSIFRSPWLASQMPASNELAPFPLDESNPPRSPLVPKCSRGFRSLTPSGSRIPRSDLQPKHKALANGPDRLSLLAQQSRFRARNRLFSIPDTVEWPLESDESGTASGRNRPPRGEHSGPTRRPNRSRSSRWPASWGVDPGESPGSSIPERPPMRRSVRRISGESSFAISRATSALEALLIRCPSPASAEARAEQIPGSSSTSKIWRTSIISTLLPQTQG